MVYASSAIANSFQIDCIGKKYSTTSFDSSEKYVGEDRVVITIKNNRPIGEFYKHCFYANEYGFSCQAPRAKFGEDGKYFEANIALNRSNGYLEQTFITLLTAEWFASKSKDNSLVVEPDYEYREFSIRKYTCSKISERKF